MLSPDRRSLLNPPFLIADEPREGSESRGRHILFERFEGEGVVSEEVMEEEIADRHQRKARTFLLRGEANIEAAHGESVTNGGEQKDGQTDEEREPGQGLGCFDLGPDQLKAEAGTFGIADLFFDGHATVIEGRQGAEGILSVGG